MRKSHSLLRNPEKQKSIHIFNAILKIIWGFLQELPLGSVANAIINEIPEEQRNRELNEIIEYILKELKKLRTFNENYKKDYFPFFLYVLDQPMIEEAFAKIQSLNREKAIPVFYLVIKKNSQEFKELAQNLDILWEDLRKHIISEFSKKIDGVFTSELLKRKNEFDLSFQKNDIKQLQTLIRNFLRMNVEPVSSYLHCLLDHELLRLNNNKKILHTIDMDILINYLAFPMSSNINSSASLFILSNYDSSLYITPPTAEETMRWIDNNYFKLLNPVFLYTQKNCFNTKDTVSDIYKLRESYQLLHASNIFNIISPAKRLNELLRMKKIIPLQSEHLDKYRRDEKKFLIVLKKLNYHRNHHYMSNITDADNLCLLSFLNENSTNYLYYHISCRLRKYKLIRDEDTPVLNPLTLAYSLFLKSKKIKNDIEKYKFYIASLLRDLEDRKEVLRRYLRNPNDRLTEIEQLIDNKINNIYKCENVFSAFNEALFKNEEKIVKEQIADIEGNEIGKWKQIFDRKIDEIITIHEEIMLQISSVMKWDKMVKVD